MTLSPPTQHLTTKSAKPPIQEGRAFRWSETLIALLVLSGTALLLYPTAAAWVSQFNQSHVMLDQSAVNVQTPASDLDSMLSEAHSYNELLESGALLKGGQNVATGTGATRSALDYWQLLKLEPTGMMARLIIPSIDLDLPVYHGTSEATLLNGIGHLQGTSLPVGGEGTRSVLTGHRGLASAEMFTRLNEVEKGESIRVEVLDQVLTYRVMRIEVVSPDATEEIRNTSGEDLLTLVTCTPLGINTHRILVTAERVLPTPQEDIESLGDRPSVPGFPWWAVGGTAAFFVVSFWYFASIIYRIRATRRSIH